MPSFYWGPQDSNSLLVGIHFGFRDLKSQGKVDVDAWETSSLTRWTPSRGTPRPFTQTSQIPLSGGTAPVRKETGKGSPTKLTPRELFVGALRIRASRTVHCSDEVYPESRSNQYCSTPQGLLREDSVNHTAPAER